MAKTCNHPTCEGPCRRPVKEKKLYRIPQVSKKRAEENKTYGPAAKQFIKDNPLCAIKSPVCTKLAEHPHHVRGRIGELLTDQSEWMPSCDPCNVYIEDNDAWARENGFKKSKFQKSS